MKRILSLIFTLLFLAPIWAPAQSKDSGGGASGSGGGSGLFRRAANRESHRWTLQEWLEQRDRNRMMDLWLAMNSPSPYEFMIGISNLSYSTQSNGSTLAYNSYLGQFSAHAQIIGITIEHENNTQEKYNDTTGMLNLRIFGNSIQSSYLTLNYGLRTRYLSDFSPELKIPQQFGQASLQLYMTRFFGIDGTYRVYQPTTDPTLGDINGTRSTAGIFIDFSAFRIFGSWYSETEKTSLAGTITEKQKTGSLAGFKIFF